MLYSYAIVLVGDSPSRENIHTYLPQPALIFDLQWRMHAISGGQKINETIWASKPSLHVEDNLISMSCITSCHEAALAATRTLREESFHRALLDASPWY